MIPAPETALWVYSREISESQLYYVGVFNKVQDGNKRSGSISNVATLMMGVDKFDSRNAWDFCDRSERTAIVSSVSRPNMYRLMDGGERPAVPSAASTEAETAAQAKTNDDTIATAATATDDNAPTSAAMLTKSTSW